MRYNHLMSPKPMYTTSAAAAVKRIMVAEVAAASSGCTPSSSMRGPCAARHQIDQNRKEPVNPDVIQAAWPGCVTI